MRDNVWFWSTGVHKSWIKPGLFQQESCFVLLKRKQMSQRNWMVCWISSSELMILDPNLGTGSLYSGCTDKGLFPRFDTRFKGPELFSYICKGYSYTQEIYNLKQESGRESNPDCFSKNVVTYCWIRKNKFHSAIGWFHGFQHRNSVQRVGLANVAVQTRACSQVSTQGWRDLNLSSTKRLKLDKLGFLIFLFIT